MPQYTEGLLDLLNKTCTLRTALADVLDQLQQTDDLTRNVEALQTAIQALDKSEIKELGSIFYDKKVEAVRAGVHKKVTMASTFLKADKKECAKVITQISRDIAYLSDKVSNKVWPVTCTGISAVLFDIRCSIEALPEHPGRIMRAEQSVDTMQAILDVATREGFFPEMSCDVLRRKVEQLKKTYDRRVVEGIVQFADKAKKLALQGLAEEFAALINLGPIASNPKFQLTR